MEKEIAKGASSARSQFAFIIGSTRQVGTYFPVVNAKLDKINAYNHIKQMLLYPDLCDAADFLDRNLPSPHKDLLWGHPLPKNYDELGNCDNFRFFKQNENKPQSELQSEINWTLIGIRKFASEINLFIAYKDLYETELIIGNYQEAEKYLDKIEKEVCFSIWTLENRFLLKELSKSSIENKVFLNTFNEKNKSDKYTKFLSHYLSLRAEKSLSVNRYSSDLENSLDRIKGDLREQYINYFRFKLSYLNNIKYTHYDAILLLDFKYSIIDRYLSLIKVFANILTISNHRIDKESENIKIHVTSRIDYLIRKVNDPILFKLKLFVSKKIFPAFDTESSRKEIAVIDKYTIGLYLEAQEGFSKLLLVKPNQFDLYVLYAKSLIYQKKPFIPLGNGKSLQNIILKNVYHIMSAAVSSKQAGLDLLSIANSISSCTLSYGIIDFVFFQTEGKKERKLLSRLSYNYANPIISEIYPDKPSKSNYLNLLRSKYPNSITVQFFESKLQDIDSLLLFEKRIPNAKFKTEHAKKLQEQGDYNTASEIWESLVEDCYDTAPLWEVAINNLYNCYEKLNRYNKCINLFVDSFMKNNFIVEKIETQSLLKKITKNAFRNIDKTIDLPIFFTIIGADETETHIAFEQFNLNSGVQKPSNLFDKFNEFEKDKIIFYLKYTCTAETLRNSPFITTSRERLEERLLISQFLKDIDISDKQFYDDEIKDIQNILIIQKGLIELDESKIYVNEQGIINSELKDYEAVFLRFKSISNIMSNSKVWMLDLKGNITTINYNKDDTKIEYSSNPVFDIYLELFEAIKDMFLYSKFGIVTYLSTRIRHGVLIGEIRPVFEKHYLITLKEGNTSSYRKNLHWERVYNNISDYTKERMQIQLKDFSSSIDGLIFDLIKNNLQVYNDANIEGWFNYDFDNEDLFHLSLKALDAKDFNVFAQQVIDVLWSRTDNNLNSIRDNIQKDIANKINILFDTLEINIVNILGKDHSELLLKAIKDCSTETQVVIKKISSWFKRSGTVTSDFELINLIDMVIQQTNKTSKIQIEKEIKFNCKIKGEFLRHFADLLRIFIENILKHSDRNTPIIHAKITIQETDNSYLCISIENEITDKRGLIALKNLWKENKMDFSKLHSEGKSGYYKAYKILTSDLRCENKGCLSTNLSEDETKFTVSLNINFKNLVI